jgi:hypothetical protein
MDTRQFLNLMRGLDPEHPGGFVKWMDCRVKPGNDAVTRW